MDPDDATPIVIRNQRYEPGFARLARVLVALTVGIGLCVLCAGSSPLGAVASVVVMILTLPVWDRFAVRFSALRPVERLKLADGIEVYPRTFPGSGEQATRVEFVPDPAEDYAEGARPVGHCEAQVDLESYGPFRLIVSIYDARRLREWAERKQIPVSDAGGLLNGPDTSTD